MKIGHLAVGMMLGRAVGAIHFLRGKVAGAIQGKQQGPAHRPKRIHHVRLLQSLEHEGKHRMDRTRFHGIQEAADVIVGGNLVYAEQGLRVVFPLRLLHRALVVQERRTLHEEYRECAQGRIDHRVLDIFPAPSVGQCFEGRPQLSGHVAEGYGIRAKRCANGIFLRGLDTLL